MPEGLAMTGARELFARMRDKRVLVVGDVMVDVLRGSVTWARMAILGELGLRTGGYYLMTLHRAGNTDDTERLETILRAVSKLPYPVVFPVHPRTRAALSAMGLQIEGSIRSIDPVGYLEILALQMHARAILTDSGGMQKEAYCLGVPCVTLRDETEWVETIDSGWNILAGADPDMIAASVDRFPPEERPALYGEGDTARKIVDRIAAGPPWERDLTPLPPPVRAPARPRATPAKPAKTSRMPAKPRPRKRAVAAQLPARRASAPEKKATTKRTTKRTTTRRRAR
ncbi:MAG: hypothetical protein NVS1B14_10860 [Vulcanimicrobiaceae bacterium]